MEGTPAKCHRCGGLTTMRWYNVVAGAWETWPCIICRPDEWDAKESAEGLNPNVTEEPTCPESKIRT